MCSDTTRRLTAIQKKIALIKSKDSNFECFGADTHQYQMNAVLTESEVTAFEQQHNLRLPEDYCLFITTIGNGGAGPYYGMISQEEAFLVSDDATDFAVSTEDVQNYLTRCEIAVNEGEEDLIEKIALPFPLTGLLCLADYGDGNYLGLAIAGEQSGTMWFVETDFKTVIPKFTKAGTQQKFLDWYEEWLDIELCGSESTVTSWNAHSKSIHINGYQLEVLPEEISQCVDLRTLNLANNKLVNFPEQIFEFRELRTLDLSMNPMTSISPNVGNLTKLKRLFINNNQLESLPLSLTTTQLKELSCSGSNQLRKLPEVVSELTHLEILNFSYSDALADLSAMKPMLKLRALNISNCKKINCLPDAIGKCKHLEELIIGETSIQQLPDSFHQLENLKKLDINCYDLDLEDTFEKIKALPQLKYLVLSNQLAYPKNIRSLIHIRHLVIKQNYNLWHKGHTKFELHENITLFPFLEELKFDNDGQVDQLPESIGQLNYLKQLHLPAVSYFPNSMKNLHQIKYIRGRASAAPKEEIEKLKSWHPQANIVFF